jgi:hypothetical protein
VSVIARRDGIESYEAALLKEIKIGAHSANVPAIDGCGHILEAENSEAAGLGQQPALLGPQTDTGNFNRNALASAAGAMLRLPFPITRFNLVNTLSTCLWRELLRDLSWRRLQMRKSAVDWRFR